MKKFLNTIRIVALAAVLAAGVSYVFAFTEPTVNPPATTPAPIHTGEPVQEKKGGIWSKRVLASPIALFKKNMFLPGNKSALRIGSGNGSTGTQSFTKGSAGAITQDLNTALFNDDTTIPLVIDLQGRAKPTDAIEFKTGLACPIATRFTNDKAAAFEFRKGTGTDRANLIARQVQLTGGNPDTKDVLVGDVNGNARWAKASVVNGVVQFSNDSVSPVIEGQSCVVTPPTQCPTGTTGMYPNCVMPLNCPAGQYASGGVCLCSGGIREDQTPTTNIQTAGKIITYANGVNQNPGGGGAPLVPYYVVLDELRRNGGPGDACKIVAWDTACPAFDLDTMRGFGNIPVTSFTFDSVTYQTTGGNSWEIDSQIGDQCTANTMAQVNGPELIMMNIEP